MRKILISLLVIFCIGLMQMALSPVFVRASNAPTQFAIPNTTLTLRGFASPNAFVQVFDGDALIGTVVADSNGVFEKQFPSMNSGLTNLRLQYDDVDAQASDVLSQTINVRAQAETAIEYFLPPTLSVTPDRLSEGDLVVFSGSTIPNATVEIILDGGNLVLRPQSGPDGRFSISVNTNNYYFGEHNIVATTKQGGLTSFQTNKRPFIVVPEGTSNDTVQPGNIDPPIILVTNGLIETDQLSQLVRGSARPNTQIVVYQDGQPVGSTFSNEEGLWFFNLSISLPEHTVRAVACALGECSGLSNEVTIVFKGDFTACSNFRLWLSEYRFWGVPRNGGIDLNITGISGTPSYEVLVDWGDSVTERFNRNNAASFKLHHVYNQTGQFNGSITVLDETGCEHTRYFSVDVQDNSSFWLWGVWIIPLALLVSYYYLRRRYGIRKKQLRLAR